jgi:uncharacterized protein (DUF433 family)
MPDSKELVESRKDVLAGTPVFKGTRVPIQALFDYLQAGEGIDEFLKDFPTVERSNVVRLLELSKEALVGGAGPRPF